MANVIYQSVAGRLWINGKDIPLDDCVMSYLQDGSIYKISIRSSSGNHSWLSNVPLTDIEDNNDGTYGSIGSWLAWWDALSAGSNVSIVDSNGAVLLPNGDPTKLTASITRPADTNNYAAGDHINAYTAAVKQKDTVTLTGTEGSVNISIPNVANRTIAFDTDLTTTAAAFVTTYAADFLPTVVVTSSGDDIIFEAATAGVPFEHPVVVNTVADLDGTVVNTTANITLAPLTLSSAAVSNGGGGFIMDFKMETDATQFAGATLRFWLFTDVPSGIVGDNVAYINSFANADKRCACAYFDCTFDALLAGSDCVIGKFQPNAEYVCAASSTSMYILVQTLSAITAPKSAGVFKFYFNVVKTA